MNAPETSGASLLFRQAAVDMGHLLVQHVKVAQLELKQELHAIVRRAWILAVLAVLLVLGYGLGMAGLAVVLGGHPGTGIPLALMGAAHVVGAGVGLVLALARRPGLQLMEASTAAMARSLEALKESTAPSMERHHVP